MPTARLDPRLQPHVRAALPALVAVVLMLVWAADNGGFDPSTWYWGALVSLATVAFVAIGVRQGRLQLSRPSTIALGLFTLYVGWSYLSMAWAQYPGLALDGSNRALLYLLLFALLTIIPWTRRTAMATMVTFVVGVGVIGVVLLARLASDASIPGLFVTGRLAAPTGYINSTAALFTIEALLAIALAARRDLPGLLRGLLIALSGAGLQLAIIVESRGWLFTLPVVALVVVILIPDRLRFTGAAVIPVLAALIPVKRLLHVYQIAPGADLGGPAMHAARPALMILAGAFFLGTMLAWADGLGRIPAVSTRARRVIGVGTVMLALSGVVAGGLVVSKGHPLRFVSRQWSGFSHPQSSFGSSHFTDVGSGRYDYWRVALDAFLSHPVGGLGQDNFGDYYLPRRHTGEEPSWTHSLELRLLAHTGIVGFCLFAGFLGFAVAAALRVRRRGDPGTRQLSAALLVPLVVWLIHGSLDWFWEIPALSGPALGFLGAAGGLAWTLEPTLIGTQRRPARAVPGAVKGVLAAALLLALTAALAFPYLSAREVSVAGATSNASSALTDLRRAAELDPLNSDAGRLAGAIALRIGDNRLAAERFRQSTRAEPGGWFAWLGVGLAESALGHRSLARRDYGIALGIDNHQPAVLQAVARVDSPHPLTSAEAFKLLVVVQ